MNLMSRHRLGRPGGHDMELTSRPSLLNLRSQPALFSLGRKRCRDIPWCRDLGWPVLGRDLHWCHDLDTVQVTVWTLFMGTVHEHCSQGKKRVQKF